jgi:hypothetical protein
VLGGVRASPAVKAATLHRDSAALTATVRQQLDERLAASPDPPEVRLCPGHPSSRHACKRISKSAGLSERRAAWHLQRDSMPDSMRPACPSYTQDADLEVVARGAGDCWVSARVDGLRGLTVVMEGRGEGGLQVGRRVVTSHNQH